MTTIEITEILQYISEKGSTCLRFHPLYSKLVESTSFLPIEAKTARRVWHISNQIFYIPKCVYCNTAPTRWVYTKYQQHCSVQCGNKNPKSLENRKQTNIIKYGVDNPRKSDKIKDKIKQTWVDKYGVDNPNKHKSVRNKIETTCMRKYGVNHSTQSIDKIRKTNETWMLKYGGHPLQTPAILEKIKTTNLVKYGVEWNLVSVSSKHKKDITCTEKYGTSNPSETDEIKNKVKQTNLEKYGGHPNQSHLADILNLVNDYDWLFDQYITQNKTATHIAVELGGIYYGTILSYLRKAEIEIKQTTWYSFRCVNWLDSIATIENISIQHALNGGEFLIPTTRYRADGYCKDTNTIYEFHGDFWHGNPNIYSSDTIHPMKGKSMGDLYQQTIRREQQIKELGYNLVVIWESDLE